MMSGKFDVSTLSLTSGWRLARLAAKSIGISPLKILPMISFFLRSTAYNWLAYYPIEKFLARHTDVLIQLIMRI
jgi:hypothetical protein